MKSSKLTLLLLSLTMIGLSIGCMSTMDNATHSDQTMQQQDMTGQKKIITKLKKELNGCCDDIGALDKKLQMKNYPPAVKVMVNDALMALRKSAWETRGTLVSGDIKEGKNQIMELKTQLAALNKKMN